MFGYLVTNLAILDKNQRKTYKSYYCGLCHSLGNNYGSIGRNTLTYDLTFINILLDGLYDQDVNIIKASCPFKPFFKHEEIFNKFSQYAADMNIYLSYYKYIDDVNDDHSRKALNKKKQLEKHITNIENRYPDLCLFIKNHLNSINEVEKNDILNPDYGCNLFGEIMGELLSSYINDENSLNLKALGYHLGRFIYLMDAIIDLKDDIKKERYNPLIQYDSHLFEEMLLMIMEDVDKAYNNLTFVKNKDLLDNIIYSGIWSKYNFKFKKKGGSK